MTVCSRHRASHAVVFPPRPAQPARFAGAERVRPAHARQRHTVPMVIASSTSDTSRDCQRSVEELFAGDIAIASSTMKRQRHRQKGDPERAPNEHEGAPEAAPDAQPLDVDERSGKPEEGERDQAWQHQQHIADEESRPV